MTDKHNNNNGKEESPANGDQLISEQVSKDSVQKNKRGKLGIAKKILWSIAKIALYVVFLVIAVLLLLLGVEKAAEIALKGTYLRDVYPENFQMALKDFNRPVSHYDYDFNPGVCLEYNTSKGNRYEYANNAGFREPRDIPPKKPKDEFRIFLTGGSTAFGLGAIGQSAFIMNNYSLEYRETISHIMEMILNSSVDTGGKKIRVYNAAVWGHAYQHGLMRYITKLRRYNPDMLISLDGVNEISLVSNLADDWNYFKEGQFHSVLSDIYKYNKHGLASYLTLWFKNNTYFMTYLWRGRDIFQTLHQNTPIETENHWALTPEKELTKDEQDKLDDNMDTVVRVVENYHSALENDGVKHIFVLQPMFYNSKKALDERERQMAAYKERKLHYGIPSSIIYEKLVNKLVDSGEKNQFQTMNLKGFFDDTSQWVYTDWCHLTAGANHLVAKAISNRIKEDYFKQELTVSDKIDNKDSYFWNVTALAKPANVPEPATPESGLANILRGYPSDLTYTSRIVPKNEPLELALDLGRTYPISRLRVVWADKESVPEKWVIEASIDNKNWIIITEGNKSQLDDYSRWPGYEYYGSMEIFGRYLRYRPIGAKDRVISLRTLAAFR